MTPTNSPDLPVGDGRSGASASDRLTEIGAIDLLGAPIPEPPKLRERDMLDRLDARYGRMYANGPHETLRHVGARHVRFNPGFSERGDRIIDYLALDAWRGSGVGWPLLGFEVKVSRSDYLSEIRDLSKSEPFRKVCSEWYMVVSDKTIVRDDLPFGWGLLVASGDGLRCVRKSLVNPEPEPMPRSLIAGFARGVAMQSRQITSPASVSDEYADCTCGHPYADHSVGVCEMKGCGCGV